MKATKTSSIIFVVFMTALIVYMCQGGQSIEGKYKVSVLPKAEISTEEEKNAMDLLSAAQIEYEFASDGTLKATTIFGEATNTADMQWSKKEIQYLLTQSVISLKNLAMVMSLEVIMLI